MINQLTQATQRQNKQTNKKHISRGTEKLRDEMI